MINVAITDDHPLVIQGLVDMLSDQGNISVTGRYCNASETLTGIKDARADVLLLDISLPDMDGTELCTLIHKGHPDIGIIALTSYDDISMVKTMIRHGAKGYLLKTVGKEELMDAIQTVVSGGEHIQNDLRSRILNETLGMGKTAAGPPRLTRREKEVLALILDERTTTEIAEELFLSPKTVESHRAVLLQKFGVRNVAGLVKQAIEHGLG